MSRSKLLVTPKSFFLFGVPICALMCLFGGCSKTEGIQVYTIPKPEDVVKNNPPVPSMAAHEAGGVQTTVPEPVDRMLGAIIPRGSKIWFFKVVGPNAAIGAQLETFAKFIETVKIGEGDDAKPSWTLPTDWTEKPGNDMRYATITVDTSAGPRELSVSALPLGPGDPVDFVLSNVNRWRGQMSLAPTNKASLFVEGSRTEEVRQSTINGMTVTFVDLVGKFQAGGMGGAPFASGARPAPPMAAGGGAPQAVPKFQTPAGWEPGQSSSFSIASFRVVDGEKKVEITVTGLPRSGLLANVNRWRGQIQLEPVSEDQFASLLEKVPVGGQTGEFVELTGKGEAGQPEAILGAIVEHQDRLWFFKLKGDAELAMREKTKFLDFLKTVKFE